MLSEVYEEGNCKHGLLQCGGTTTVNVTCTIFFNLTNQMINFNFRQ